jgi:2-polyprenyl-3-methyl-5-hydroxy-6-metoxy-1,4-benzoquinol methylase
VPAGARDILDCGCAAGALGAQLTERGCHVIGIEPHAPAAALARGRMARVIESTVEDALGQIAESSFDCVICADVLEDLVDPWATTAALVARLRPGGVFVCSVPNIRHLGVLIDLVCRGRWTYRDEGILDRAHLRFFTRSSLVDMLSGAGLTVDLIVPSPEGYTGRVAFAAACLGLFSGEWRAAQWLARTRKLQP